MAVKSLSWQLHDSAAGVLQATAPTCHASGFHELDRLGLQLLAIPFLNLQAKPAWRVITART
jgi:hypothetical protein